MIDNEERMMLFEGICECPRCGVKRMYYFCKWTAAPDNPDEEVISVTLWCQNEDCEIKRRGFGVRIEKE